MRLVTSIWGQGRTWGLVLGLFLVSSARGDAPKADAKAKPKPVLPTGTMDTSDWLKYDTAALQPGEIDRLVETTLKKANITPASLTTDEQFLRRVYIDLVGKPPAPSDIVEFLKDKTPNKRAAVIDRLLASDDFARHWALYFRDVIASRTTSFQARIFARHFDRWMTEQFKENKSWADITRALLTATGEMRNDTPDKNGQAFFLGSRMGADAVTERAAETSRIFLGIQIQCAQCHDHPSDVWKRNQFHEFAAYFARLRERPIFENMRIVGQALMSVPFGEHRMPDANDPKKGTPMSPRFLDGKAPTASGKFKFAALSDVERRKALADAIVSRENPWFAAAFVNRIWGELMGQSFYQPIDDLGPQKEALMPEVLARIAASFRGSDYDIKGLFRVIANSQTYQRQTRPGEAGEEHLLFAAHNPVRMGANALWQNLVNTLGDLSPRGGFFPKKGFGPFAGPFSLEGLFKQEFGFDPSSKSDEIEGSVSQALLLMNSPVINQKIRASQGNVLARILATYESDDEALRALYLKTLSRRPSEREMERCKTHLRGVANRAEAFEDILWALINSTEFQTKR